jgi:hypothetical protein
MPVPPRLEPFCILHFAFGDGVAFAVDAPKDGKDPEGLMRNAGKQEGTRQPHSFSCFPTFLI